MHDFKNTHVFYIESQNNTVQTFFFFISLSLILHFFFLARLAATLSANVGDKIIASIFPELISCVVLIQWSGWYSGIHDRLLYCRLCVSWGGEKKKKQSRVRTPFLFSFSAACYRGQALKKQPKKSLQAKFIHSSKTQLKNALLIKNDTKWS